jgi:hypothetical protein
MLTLKFFSLIMRRILKVVMNPTAFKLLVGWFRCRFQSINSDILVLVNELWKWLRITRLYRWSSNLIVIIFNPIAHSRLNICFL